MGAVTNTVDVYTGLQQKDSTRHANNGNRAGLVFKSLDGFSVAGINGVIDTHSGTQNNNVGYLEFYTKTSVSAAEDGTNVSDGSVQILFRQVIHSLGMEPMKTIILEVA